MLRIVWEIVEPSINADISYISDFYYMSDLLLYALT